MPILRYGNVTVRWRIREYEQGSLVFVRHHGREGYVVRRPWKFDSCSGLWREIQLHRLEVGHTHTVIGMFRSHFFSLRLFVLQINSFPTSGEKSTFLGTQSSHPANSWRRLSGSTSSPLPYSTLLKVVMTPS